MNSTPQEKQILRKFYKNLDRKAFTVTVLIMSGNYTHVEIRENTTHRRVFGSWYFTQADVLDNVEEVCMIVTFGVGQ